MGINQHISLLPDMATFVLVVETGSFSAAARKLGITPSAVSRQMSRLEGALSTRLLERSTRKLRLTDAGAEAFERCKEIDRAARAVMEINGKFSLEAEGQIRVSMPKAIGRFVVHPHVPSFLRAYPKVDVQLILTDAYVDLIDDNVDMAIRITDHPAEGLAGRPLMPIRHMICATERYLAERGTPQHPKDLVNHSCIYLGENPEDCRWKFTRGDESIAVNVKGRYVANHTEVRLHAVQEHLGIGSLPYFTAREALQSKSIVRVLPDWDLTTSYSGTAWMLYLPNRYLPLKLRVFIDYLVRCLETESILTGINAIP